MTIATIAPRPRRNFLLFALLTLVFSYLTLLGATFNGILGLVNLQPLTPGLLGVLAAGWLFAHWRLRWRWQRTALDPAIVLWLIAFVVSIAANTLTWRRSAEALWYMFLYIALWYLLADALANGGLSRDVLVRAFLLTGFVVMLFGWWQVGLLLSDPQVSGIPRPVSLIGNPNAFGVFLVVLIPLAVMQISAAQRRFARFILIVYAASALALLVLSQSRGAWIGTAASFAIAVLLILADRKLLTIAALRIWWSQRSTLWNIAMIAAAVVLLLLSILMGIYLIQSLSEGGRSIELRTYLWDAAWRMFSEKPLTGQGLFTFGHYLPRYSSIPPTQPHAHAHNVPFTIIAEMGLPGLLAFAVSAVLVLRAMWHNWKYVQGTERPYFIGGASAVIGFGVHHLVDTPAMMPLIALVGLLVLAIAVVPGQSEPLQAVWRKRLQPVGLIGVWVVLLAFGFFSSNLYARYFTILQTVNATGDYFTAAEAMQPIIDADPYQPAYLLQQGYLYGMAAADGDTEAAARAIAAYQRYVALEPHHASVWANLAALYWQTDNRVKARAAIEQAIQYAPDWPHFQRQRDIYAGVLTGAERIEPPESVYAPSWSRFQYLREPLGEFIPQVGWGVRG